jgi:hypothetical protein
MTIVNWAGARCTDGAAPSLLDQHASADEYKQPEHIRRVECAADRGQRWQPHLAGIVFARPALTATVAGDARMPTPAFPVRPAPNWCRRKWINVEIIVRCPVSRNRIADWRKSDNFGIVFGCDLSNQCMAAFSNCTDPHRPSIFWRPRYTHAVLSE